RAGRLARMAGVSARFAANRLGVGNNEEATRQAASTLAKMRGLAAKLGQMTAYVDGLVPEERRETYERYMGVLLDGSAASPRDAVRAVIEEDLGSPPEALFAT